jgi:GNAT superfamily N-acetyltransferase
VTAREWPPAAASDGDTVPGMPVDVVVRRRLTDEEIPALAAMWEDAHRRWGPRAADLRARLPGHAALDGFVAVVARSGEDPVGLAYGYRGERGRWWSTQMERALAPRQRREWLSEWFEVVEIAVRPDHQGRGIGSRVHDRLLEEAGWPRALLTARADDPDVRAFYERRGWRAVKVGVRLGGGEQTWALYGRPAGARAASASSSAPR